MSIGRTLQIRCVSDRNDATDIHHNKDPIGKYRANKGDPLPAGFDLAAWRAKHFNFATDNVPKWVDAVKEAYGGPDTKYACTGYCFGAPFVMDLLAGERVAAGAFAHPTALKEEHFVGLKRESSVSLKKRC